MEKRTHTNTLPIERQVSVRKPADPFWNGISRCKEEGDGRVTDDVGKGRGYTAGRGGGVKLRKIVAIVNFKHFRRFRPQKCAPRTCSTYK